MSDSSRTAVGEWSGSPPGQDQQDDATVIRMSHREPERFAALFHRHAPLIGRYVVRRLGVASTDDIVAETFLVAFGRRESYDLTRPDARPWLYGIATNLIRRHQRDEVRQLRALERTGTDPVMDPFTDFTDRVDDRVSTEAVSRRLAGAIAGLPAAHRDLLLLVAWAELTYDQAGQALGIPAGTVRSRMNRVRTRLRRALGGIDPTAIAEEPGRG